MENENKFKILVVDDDQNFCALAKRILESMQYQVDIATGGEEAISKIHDFEPQVVLLDVKMPRLTGDELVKMIKAWKPHIEVIMVTAVHNHLLERDCMQNGAFAYFTKPLKFDQLEEKLREALEGPE